MPYNSDYLKDAPFGRIFFFITLSYPNLVGMELTPQQLQIIIHAIRVEVLEYVDEVFNDNGDSIWATIQGIESYNHTRKQKAEQAAQDDWERLRDMLVENGVNL